MVTRMRKAEEYSKGFPAPIHFPSLFQAIYLDISMLLIVQKLVNDCRQNNMVIIGQRFERQKLLFILALRVYVHVYTVCHDLSLSTVCPGK